MTVFATSESATISADALDEDTARSSMTETAKALAVALRILAKEEDIPWLYVTGTAGVAKVEVDWIRDSAENFDWTLAYLRRLALRMNNKRLQELIAAAKLWLRDNYAVFPKAGFRRIENLSKDFDYLNDRPLASRYFYKAHLKSKRKEPVWVTSEKPNWL